MTDYKGWPPEADEAAGLVLVPRVITDAFDPMLEAAKQVALGVDKTTLRDAINAAIAAGSRRKE